MERRFLNLSPKTLQVFGFFNSCDRHEGDVPEFVTNVKGIFHNDAMLQKITEAVMIISPHSLYHLIVNLSSAKCLFICLFVCFYFWYFICDKQSAGLGSAV